MSYDAVVTLGRPGADAGGARAGAVSAAGHGPRRGRAAAGPRRRHPAAGVLRLLQPRADHGGGALRPGAGGGEDRRAPAAGLRHPGPGRAGPRRAPAAGAARPRPRPPFLNNTPIVAMLVPQVADWAERGASRRRATSCRSPSPRSSAAWSPPSGRRRTWWSRGSSRPPARRPSGCSRSPRWGSRWPWWGSPGWCCSSPILVPERRPARRELDEEFREFVVNMLVQPRGPVDGRTVAEAGLRHLQGVFLVEIERDGDLIAPVPPTTVLHGDDRLTFVGKADLVVDLQATRGLALAERDHTGGLDTARHTFFEAVVGEVSPLVGRTLQGDLVPGALPGGGGGDPPGRAPGEGQAGRGAAPGRGHPDDPGRPGLPRPLPGPERLPAGLEARRRAAGHDRPGLDRLRGGPGDRRAARPSGSSRSSTSRSSGPSSWWRPESSRRPRRGARST